MMVPNRMRVAGWSKIAWSWGAALGAGFAVVSCKRAGDTMEIVETREVSKFAPSARAGLSTPERFGEKSPLTWQVPQGWSDAGRDPSGGMRLINLKFGPADEGECYVSVMPGAAGGLGANINRWRGQMGLPPLSDEEIANLPKKPFFNREGTYVNLDGDFTGVGAAQSSKNYRMVGLVVEAPDFTIFVKMTGPKELVEKNESAFDEFVQSISGNR